jgi:hypothetical protein
MGAADRVRRLNQNQLLRIGFFRPFTASAFKAFASNCLTPSARTGTSTRGHTHGGQLCLPGGIPIKLEAAMPRFMGAGPWRHGRIYLGGRWHEHSACALKLPAGDNSAYLARWAAALAHEQVRCRKTKRGIKNIPSRYPRNDRFAPIPAVQYAISERKIDRRTSNFLANV